MRCDTRCDKSSSGLCRFKSSEEPLQWARPFWDQGFSCTQCCFQVIFQSPRKGSTAQFRQQNALAQRACIKPGTKDETRAWTPSRAVDAWGQPSAEVVAGIVKAYQKCGLARRRGWCAFTPT